MATPKKNNSVSDRIIKAGLALLEEAGVKALTQSRIAKRSGVRQSHVTYYFPRIDDLLVAIFEASHVQSRTTELSVRRDPLTVMSDLLFDRVRMGFFLRIVAEVSGDDELRPVVSAHVQSLSAAVAPFFGRRADDPAVVDFVDLMRGRALRFLVDPDEIVPDLAEMIAAATLFSLKPEGDPGAH